MEAINFEGKIVKPTPTGIYRCPYNCSQKGYPAKKWKTESGFKKHMTECPKRPSAVEKRNEAELARLDMVNDWKNTLEYLKEELLYSLNIKVGQEVYWVRGIVVKDTHEWRGNRSVKVRYEPVLSFVPEKTIVISFTFEAPVREPDLDYAKQLLIINNVVHYTALVDSFEKAKDIAFEKTKADEDHRNHSSMLR